MVQEVECGISPDDLRAQSEVGNVHLGYVEVHPWNEYRYGHGGPPRVGHFEEHVEFVHGALRREGNVGRVPVAAVCIAHHDRVVDDVCASAVCSGRRLIEVEDEAGEQVADQHPPVLGRKIFFGLFGGVYLRDGRVSALGVAGNEDHRQYVAQSEEGDGCDINVEGRSTAY